MPIWTTAYLHARISFSPIQDEEQRLESEWRNVQQSSVHNLLLLQGLASCTLLRRKEQNDTHCIFLYTEQRQVEDDHTPCLWWPNPTQGLLLWLAAS